nr:PREDICTED: uncharacterized protein LOC105669639 [Linepithema humile]
MYAQKQKKTLIYELSRHKRETLRSFCPYAIMDKFVIKKHQEAVEKKSEETNTKTNAVGNDCSLPLDTIIQYNNKDSSESESDVEMVEENITKPKKKKYTQKFKIEWKQKWTWLENIKGSSYCTLCNKTLMGGITHLERHAQSNMHKKQEIYLSKVSMTDLKILYSRNTTVRVAELKLCMFLSEHNLPVRILQHLPKYLLQKSSRFEEDSFRNTQSIFERLMQQKLRADPVQISCRICSPSSDLLQDCCKIRSRSLQDSVSSQHTIRNSDARSSILHQASHEGKSPHHGGTTQASIADVTRPCALAVPIAYESYSAESLAPSTIASETPPQSNVSYPSNIELLHNYNSTQYSNPKQHSNSMHSPQYTNMNTVPTLSGYAPPFPYHHHGSPNNNGQIDDFLKTMLDAIEKCRVHDDRHYRCLWQMLQNAVVETNKFAE